MNFAAIAVGNFVMHDHLNVNQLVFFNYSLTNYFDHTFADDVFSYLRVFVFPMTSALI